ncbi:hypothetical protein HOO65_010520 [Ceratocystis lukuohia]|uniref:Uncharacterized protein n=1 Tax=Ceratocystis lukuohia TaxID=2019550 RepID=A0ABR4MSA3_9PEZI
MKIFVHLAIATVFCGGISGAQLVAQDFSIVQTCETRSIFGTIPVDGFEPSDASWDADSQLLYVVDDNGRLASIPGYHLREAIQDSFTQHPRNQGVLLSDLPGSKDVKIWSITHGMDLEGCAVDHEFPDLVYLGVENPAEILAFNVTAGAIQHRYAVGAYFVDDPTLFTSRGNELKKHKKNRQKKGKDKARNTGLESLAFYPGLTPGAAPRLLVGRQSDSNVFVFDLVADRSSVKFVGSVNPPGPGRDLSAISVFLGKVYFVFDKEFEAISVPVRQFEAAIKPPKRLVLGESNPEKYEKDKPEWVVQRYEFDIRGQEGFAFAYSSFACALGSKGCSGIGETPVVYAIDPPRKPKLEKDILVGSFSQLQQCWRV